MAESTWSTSDAI